MCRVARSQIARPTTWELRLTDGPFTLRAAATTLTALSGAPTVSDLVVTTQDEELHRLLTRQLTPAKALAAKTVTLEGDVAALPLLLDLFAFPMLDGAPA